MKNGHELLDECFRTAEVSDGGYFAGEIFRHKLGGELPDYGRHVVAFYKPDWDHIVPLGYQHVLEYEGLGLCGGGSVDGRGFRHVPDHHREELRDRGGVLFLLLRHVIERMENEYEAFFVYCGDKRSQEVCHAAGFQRLEGSFLMPCFHRPLAEGRKQELLEIALNHGPF